MEQTDSCQRGEDCGGLNERTWRDYMREHITYMRDPMDRDNRMVMAWGKVGAGGGKGWVEVGKGEKLGQLQ